MKTAFAATIVAAASVSAHSWIECVNHDNSQILPWMQGNATQNVLIDPAMPWYANFCHGWPRAKQNPGNWIDESTNLVWNLVAKKFEGDHSACNPLQRTPNQAAGAPVAQIAAGSSFRLRFGGNGHTRGSGTADGNPGQVSVYWLKTPGAQIETTDGFKDENLLKRAGFADESFSYPEGVKKPTEGLVDKGNWMTVPIPAETAPGSYPMTWVWSYDGVNQWSSCFDVEVIAGAGAAVAPIVGGKDVDVPAVPAPIVAPVVPEPGVPAPVVVPAPGITPGPVPNVDVVFHTEYTTTTTTKFYKNKRVHARKF